MTDISHGTGNLNVEEPLERGDQGGQGQTLASDPRSETKSDHSRVKNPFLEAPPSFVFDVADDAKLDLPNDQPERRDHLSSQLFLVAQRK
jgi:hypothetical protein